MRRQKAVIVIDVEIDDELSVQDVADIFNQVLNTEDRSCVHDLAYFEHDKYNETFNELLDEVKFEFEYGSFRDMK